MADKKLICDACKTNEAAGVACIPYMPMSVAYCLPCLEKNNHPINALIVNTAACGGLEHTHIDWTNMVLCSLGAQGLTLEWFNEQVNLALDEFKQIENESEEPMYGS